MTRTSRILATATLLAAGLAAAGATAAELRLKSRTGGGGVPTGPTVLKGNIPALADLVVSPMNGNTSGLPNTGVCGSWSQGYTSVKFKVKNQGAVATPIASFALNMQKGGKHVGGAVLQIPALNPGQTTTMSLPVPAEAQPGYHGTLVVKGRADTPNYVPETIENNNWHTGYCHGPAT